MSQRTKRKIEAAKRALLHMDECGLSKIDCQAIRYLILANRFISTTASNLWHDNQKLRKEILSLKVELKKTD